METIIHNILVFLSPRLNNKSKNILVINVELVVGSTDSAVFSEPAFYVEMFFYVGKTGKWDILCCKNVVSEEDHRIVLP